MMKVQQKEKEQIYKDLSDGKIDIIIGTHQLTNKSIIFNDLGLLIVDEEQKFGVSVKESIRSIKNNIDVLSLTATPEARSLFPADYIVWVDTIIAA